MIPGIDSVQVMERLSPAGLTLSRVGVVTLALALVLLLTACGGASASVPQGQLQVVTTGVILEDMVKNVGGPDVAVNSIVPPGADLHSFQSTPEDSAAISRAHVVISHGAGLDDFLFPVIESARSPESRHTSVAQGLEAPAVGTVVLDGDHEEGHEGEHGEVDDPHFWQDPRLVVTYVERIRDALAQASPENAPAFRERAAAYMQELQALDREIEDTLAQVPPERRHLVTFHNAFGHFGRRYDWRVTSLVLGDASEVTPGNITAVLEALREEEIPAVFVEPQYPAGIVRQTARDSGIAVGTIYSDTLDDQVSSYAEMMRFNANSLAEHLR